MTAVPILAFLSGNELWLILGLALLFFGATRLPQIARSMGKSVNEFKTGLKEGAEGVPESGSGESASEPKKDD